MTHLSCLLFKKRSSLSTCISFLTRMRLGYHVRGFSNALYYVCGKRYEYPCDFLDFLSNSYDSLFTAIFGEEHELNFVSLEWSEIHSRIGLELKNRESCSEEKENLSKIGKCCFGTFPSVIKFIWSEAQEREKLKNISAYREREKMRRRCGWLVKPRKEMPQVCIYKTKPQDDDPKELPRRPQE